MATKFSRIFKNVLITRSYSTTSDNGLTNKFQGCILGSLVGDCFGAPYKLSDDVSKTQLQKYFDKLDGPPFKAPYKPFSSATALSHQLAQSLIDQKSIDLTDIAERFVKEFLENPNRSYGSTQSKILIRLHSSKFKDLFAPAKEEFLGLGSYGNKAAVRVHPLVIFHHKSEINHLLNDVQNTSAITHANQLAINGAILQSLAVKLALTSQTLNSGEFIKSLLDLSQQNLPRDNYSVGDSEKYIEQLHKVKKLLSTKNISNEEVVNCLGHSKVALYSVPTAIFCFLRASQPIEEINTDNPFRRSVQYAISLGGDTDSIAAMTGTISGAFYGKTLISDAMLSHCEKFSTFNELSNKFK